MNSPLRILHLEDDPNDAAIIHSTLKNGGIPCTVIRVEDQESFEAALETGEFDLILSDFTLPTFDGMSALESARVRTPHLPLIFISGTLGEERAIDSLRNGATDYVVKERLNRLVPAVRRAMKEVDERIERQRLEAQFIEGQKMEVIGQLAGGVAHDFNNILGVIMGYTELLTSDLEPASPLRKFTDEIRHASERAAGLTRQLLVFSRKKTVQPIALDLNQIMSEMDQMLRRLIFENIEMSVLPGEMLGWVKADPGYVCQILMNLTVNARDAMPNGGNLTIATANITFDEVHSLAGHPSIKGDFVMLSVSDTGTGMTDEVKARIFEAFFTTKGVGKGTGLGLATCQNIVRLSGGYIDVFTQLGKGTTFKVYFPRVEQPAAVAARPTEVGPLPRGTESLLVVEDDQAVRLLACSVLQAQG
jgi:two-component system cell cycle sensor histidine kinase/response regulator CckA